MISNHLTPEKLQRELQKFDNTDCEVYVINIKPMYRNTILDQLAQLEIERLKILDVGRVYEW